MSQVFLKWCLPLLTLIIFIPAKLFAFESSLFHPIILDKNWKFCPQTTFTENVKAQSHVCFDIELPNQWESIKPDYNGFAILKTEFMLQSKQIDSPLGLQIERVRDADKVFLNGELIGQFGEFPPNFQKGVLHSRLYKIPTQRLRIDEPNHLVIWIFNDARAGGINQVAPVIDDYFKLSQDQFNKKSQFIILMVVLFIFGIIHLFYFMLNRVNQENCYYGLYMLAWTLYLFTHSPFSFESGLSLNFIFRSNVALFFVSYSLLPLFLFALFEQRLTKPIKAFSIFGFAMVPLCFILPETKHLYIPLEIAELSIFIPMALLVKLLIQSIKLKRPYAKSITSVVLLYFVLASFDVWIDYTQSKLISSVWTFGVWALVLLSLTMTFLMAHKYRNYLHKATTDELTSVLRRDEFILQLNRELERAIKEKHYTVVLMIDLDNFKLINDTYGHSQGDVVLSMVTRSLKSRLRLFDLIGRYGGDEFCLSASFENKSEIKPFVERLRKAVNGLSFLPNKSKNDNASQEQINATFGAVVQSPQDKQSAMQLLNKADQLLINAKAHEKGSVFWV